MEAPDDLVSDHDRERAVASLRDNLLAGRLSLEEFAERVELAYSARIAHQLALAQRNLPERQADPSLVPQGKATRLTVSLFGRAVRRGKLRLRRRTLAASVFSDLDLDLREAELVATESTVTVLVAFANADVYVPEAVHTSVGGLSVFSRRRDWGRDAARADAPRIHVRVFSLFGTIDVWRVSTDMRGDYGEILRQLRDRQRQLRE